MSLMMKLVRDRMLKARGSEGDNNKEETKSLKDITISNISEVDKVFPGASDMLKETAIVESKLGMDTRAGNNVFQLTETGIDAVKDIKSHPGLSKYHKKIKEKFDIDIMNSTYEDFKTNPLLNTLGARMMYGIVPDAIPNTVEGRASYWDANYNSTADTHGTSQTYMKQVKAFEY
tara:strand:- start:273 stop:797 length:525 start_codon:yes stop_codon:yes gene_type:complete